MSRLVITLLVVAVLAIAVCGQPNGKNKSEKNKCGKNEVFAKCKDQCPPTCGNPVRLFCAIQKCTPGCDCAKGYVRNEKGECVKPKHCQKYGNKIPHFPPDL